MRGKRADTPVKMLLAIILGLSVGTVAAFACEPGQSCARVAPSAWVVVYADPPDDGVVIVIEPPPAF